MSKDFQSIRNLIQELNTGKKYPALSIVRSNPEVAAIISKLVKPKDLNAQALKNMEYGVGFTQGRMNDISASIKQRNIDADNMMQLFPDLELAAQIIISSVLSPKDMVNTDLIYSVKDTVIPHELSMKLCEVLKTELDTHYNIQDQLPTMLREVLFDRGSYIKAVIPENSIDDIINSNMSISRESLSVLFDKNDDVVHLGILGPSGSNQKQSSIRIGLGLESFSRGPTVKPNTYVAADPNNILKLVINDNYQLLKLPTVIEANNKAKLDSIIGLESKKTTITPEQMEVFLYKGPQSKAQTFVQIKTSDNASRRSVGRPLDMKLPPEAVIPVHVPGNESKHIGYFVLIDEEGNPLTRNQQNEYLGDLNTHLNNSQSSITSFLLEKARSNLVTNDLRNLTLDQASSIYAALVEKDLVERMRSGLYGSKVEISGNEEIYQMMLARTFANQYTRLVYIPAELVTYFAYKYHDNGIGKSMLDDLKILISLRAILLFAKVMALTKSSINLTHVGVTFDPNDPDPYKTAEEAVHEIIRMRQLYFPLGINTPTDLVDMVQRAGFEFSFEYHPGFPQTKFDFETKNLQHTVPDNDLDEMLRKQNIMAFGLSPETVDSGFSAEFATTVVANNILLSKRILQIQNVVEPKVSDYAQKITLNDSTIYEKLLNVVKEAQSTLEANLPDDIKKDFLENPDGFNREIVNIFIKSLKIGLPKPDITTHETQSQAYTQYAESLDAALDAWINQDILSGNISSDLNGHADMIKAIFKAYFLRKYMSESGYLTELSDIVSADENGKPAIDIETMMKEHVEGITRSAVSYIKSIQPMMNAAGQDLQNMGMDNQDSGSYGGGDEGSSTGEETDMSGDMGFDMGGDEEKAPAEEPTE